MGSCESGCACGSNNKPINEDNIYLMKNRAKSPPPEKDQTIIKQNKRRNETTDLDSEQHRVDSICDYNDKGVDPVIVNLASNSNHNIDYILDKDAAKRNDGFESDVSISDLSDGFDADETLAKFQGTNSNSPKKLLRFKSKNRWDETSLDQHEDDIVKEMHRLSMSGIGLHTGVVNTDSNKSRSISQ